MAPRSYIPLLAALLLLCGAVAAHASAKKLTERQKIEQLITAVEQLEGATFIRNGAEYTPRQAAAHLRTKLGRAGNRVKTAQDFIDGLATSSYLTGKPYHIRLQGGQLLTTKELLDAWLRAMGE